MKYIFDDSTKFYANAAVILGGSPLTIMRLGSKGSEVARSVLSTGSIAPELQSSSAVTALVEKFVDRSILHPVPDVRNGYQQRSDAGEGRLHNEVTAVVPVKDRPDELDRCLRAISASGIARVIVVDDGSADARAHQQVTDRHGADKHGADQDVIMMRNETSKGPAAARNRGAAAVGSRLIAFIDSDVSVSPDWLDPLVDLMKFGPTKVVAPRVRSEMGESPSRFERYEAVASPIDMGADPALVRQGSQVSYLPAAALLVDAAVFAELGGFDEAMRFGEDVDFIWRCEEMHRGAVRYEPSSIVGHVPRSNPGSGLVQRFEYGLSAAQLDERHPGAVHPARFDRWTAASAVLMLTRFRPLAVLGILRSTKRAIEALEGVEERQRIAATIVMSGYGSSAKAMMRLAVRPLFPALVLGLVLQRSRRTAAVILACSVAVRTVELTQRSDEPVGCKILSNGLFSVVDDLAYSAGVWVGAVKRRRFKVLLPEIR